MEDLQTKALNTKMQLCQCESEKIAPGVIDSLVNDAWLIDVDRLEAGSSMYSSAGAETGEEGDQDQATRIFTVIGGNRTVSKKSARRNGARTVTFVVDFIIHFLLIL